MNRNEHYVTMPGPRAGPAIAVRGLRKSFGTKVVVAGIDLEIAAGSFAGLVGPNGAGKAARFWTYQRRDPGSLIYWAIIAVIMVAGSAGTVLTPAYLGGLLASAGAGAAFVAVFHANSIGMTGPGFTLEATALTGRRGLRAWFCGQDLAHAVIAAPLLTVISFALAAAAGHPADGALGTAVALAGTGAALALSNIFTVTMPYPAEQRAGSPVPWPADGYAGHAIAGIYGSILGTAIAVSPVVLAALLTQPDPTGSGYRPSCCAPPGTASHWPGPACGSPPMWPGTGSRNSARSPSAASHRPPRTRDCGGTRADEHIELPPGPST